VRIRGAGHSDAADHIFQAIVGFVADRGASRFLVHARFHAATLNHEIGNHPVEQGAVVESVLNVLDEIGGGGRGALVIVFDADDAPRSLQIDHGRRLTVRESRAGLWLGGGAGQDGPTGQTQQGRGQQRKEVAH
jgi:hypothetical protein